MAEQEIMQILVVLDIVGTIAFALSGAMVAAQRGMDLFGINVLGAVTATCGGIIRDLVIGSTPPAAFVHPRYVLLAVGVSNITFLCLRKVRKAPAALKDFSARMLFVFDTMGLAAFTMDGIITGVNAGHGRNLFLICFLGVITGVGGGIMRDILAGLMPTVFRKHVYALASIAGGALTALLNYYQVSMSYAILAGFFFIIIIRIAASYFRWNLPRIE